MTNKQSRRNKRGFVLPLTIAVVVLLTVMGLALQRLGLDARMQAARTTAEITASAAADAGLTKAVFEMNQNQNGETWSFSNIASAVNIELPNANADYTYTIEEIVVDTEYRITSIGRSGLAERKVYCNIERESSIFEYAVFAQNGIEFKNGVLIDGYDSEIGPYGGTNLQSGSVGTNSIKEKDILLHNGTEINGDVVVGPGGDPSEVIHMSGHATITGDTYANGNEKRFPEIIVPILTDKGQKPTGTITTSGKYDTIDITDSQVLTIVGDVILDIKKEVKIDNGASIVVTEGSSLQLYIGDDFISTNEGTINNLTKSPPRCKIYSTSNSSVEYLFDNESNVYAAVYAPKADLEIKNTCNIYGAIVAAEFKIDNGAQIHYDHALGRTTGDEAEFVISGWRE